MKKGNSRQEFNLVAEGIRKMVLLWQLVKNGTLEKGSVLFWDESEANINPVFHSFKREKDIVKYATVTRFDELKNNFIIESFNALLDEIYNLGK